MRINFPEVGIALAHALQHLGDGVYQLVAGPSEFAGPADTGGNDQVHHLENGVLGQIHRQFGTCQELCCNFGRAEPEQSLDLGCHVNQLEDHPHAVIHRLQDRHVVVADRPFRVG